MSKLSATLQFDDLELVRYLKERESPFLAIIQGILEDAAPILDHRISAIFPGYTLHDSGHSFRIVRYMAGLVEDHRKLSELEIALLVCAALLHDVGMGVSDDDLNAIKADTFPFSGIKYSAMLTLLDGNEKEATQEYVRRIHAELSGRYIRTNLKEKLAIPGMPHLDLTDDLALICESHTKNYDWIRSNLTYYEVRGDHAFNPQYIACILRLGDILDIDANRTPYRLYRLVVPKGQSELEWRQHFDIFNNEKISANPKTQLREICFYGRSKNADIHRKILTYIDWVQAELTGALTLVAGMKSEYNLPFEEKPRDEIKPEGFTFSEYKMTLKFEAISSLLMGDKIYGSKQLGLRELIQNSLDACRIRQESEKPGLGEEPYVPKIRVILDKERNQVIVKDNGVGMSLDIIKRHFLNIGVSYYRSFDFLLQDLDYKPIGNYGIGFLSCFMLSDEVAVKTRHFLAKELYVIQLEKGQEWISLTAKEEVSFFGTEVTLKYEQFLLAFDAKPEKVTDFLNRFFLTDGIDFQLLQGKDATLPIKNELYPGNTPDKSFIKIDLAEHLNDIEGYTLIRKKTDFVRSVGDLPLDETIYLYRPPAEQREDEDYFEYRSKLDDWEWLTLPPDLDAVEIHNYVNGTELRYLSIPLITRGMRGDFESGMRFTDDDVESVIDKLGSKLDRISILLPKDFQKYESDEEIDARHAIIEGVELSFLVSLGHESDLPTYKSVKTIKLFEGSKNQLYLPFEERERFFHIYGRSNSRQELFIRSVLIKDFRFDFPVTASIFDVTVMVTNVHSRKFIPDISRNNVDGASGEELNYIVGKAIHQGAIRHLGLGEEEQRALRDFTDRFYGRESEFEKSDAP